jgi:hypothetical protein
MGENAIMHLWTYSITLWKFRNGVVHGHTIEAAKTQEFIALRARIREELAQYQADRFIVSPKYAFLFTKLPISERLQQDRDSMTAWLRSVELAKTNQQVFWRSLPTIKKFLQPKDNS